MKTIVALSALFAVALAKPSALLTPVVFTAPVTSSQYHAQDEFGQYNYGYANEHSSKSEVKTFDGITRGAYSYIDAEGNLQNVAYTADDVYGFRVTGTNLPEAPIVAKVALPQAPAPVEDTKEVAEAKAKHMEELEKAKKIAEADKPIEATAALHVEAIPAAIPYAAPFYHHFAPIAPAVAPIAYSYGVPAAHYTSYATYAAPHVTAYAAPVIAPITKTIETPLVAPVAPSETPEVAKAREEHLAEVEKVKARNA